jgi:hypothetical protein
LLAGVVAAALAVPAPARAADEIDVRDTVRRGLEWVAKTQIVDDTGGHWEANGGQYPTSMTALAGMVLLMDGSTMREGRYSEQVTRAVDWFLRRVQPNGLLGNTNNPTEAARYMYGQGFGTLFLACIYGEEDRPQRRKELEKVLTKAVEFIGHAQTDRGGWGYISAKEGGNFDEGSVTITQLQALRAARDAGIVVPKSIIDKAVKYLKDSTTQRGGIIYSLTHGAPAIGGERPPRPPWRARSAPASTTSTRKATTRTSSGSRRCFPTAARPSPSSVAASPTTSTRTTTSPRPSTSSATTAS